MQLNHTIIYLSLAISYVPYSSATFESIFEDHDKIIRVMPISVVRALVKETKSSKFALNSTIF